MLTIPEVDLLNFVKNLQIFIDLFHKLNQSYAKDDGHVHDNKSLPKKDLQISGCLQSVSFLKRVNIENLTKDQEEFYQFLKVVRNDVESKGECWLHVNENSGTKLKGYSSLQVYILGLYLRRIDKFERMAAKSLKQMEQEDVKDDLKYGGEEAKIELHLHILKKMKRRMKQIMDVSDIYAVPTMVSAVNPCLSNIDHLGYKDLIDKSELNSSVISLESNTHIQSLSEVSELRIHETELRTKRAFSSSVYDHMCALSKSYTQIS